MVQITQPDQLWSSPDRTLNQGVSLVSLTDFIVRGQLQISPLLAGLARLGVLRPQVSPDRIVRGKLSSQKAGFAVRPTSDLSTSGMLSTAYNVDSIPAPCTNGIIGAKTFPVGIPVINGTPYV